MAPTLSEPELTGPYNEAFQKIQDGIKKAVDGFNSLVQKVNKWSWLLGAAALLWVKRGLEAVRDALAKAIEKVKYALEHQVPVLSLIINSFRWVNSVKTPVSDLSFAITEPADQDLPKWTGDAASSYLHKAAQQKGAVDDMVLKAEFISQWLFKIAKSNVDFALELAKLVTGLAGEIIEAAGEAAGVITIPLIVETLSDSVGELVEAGLNRLVDVGSRFVEALGNVRDINGQVGDHTKLPGGRWPEAVRG
ncbi:hypothetical protein I0C86_19085 [Plantactinospora sp. S1510]|uniref:Uncharacterized protein n=1 Tax=Plantactinospora alkalitolerans TaxID=2789879 RepID=A0ABS0GXV5_9ACTN|nr:hypothetical protein [Plantactinospora alkalitolerans]MBF9131046.1 hypothetical protein [Plantactinospora alkalitolerans]